MNSFNKNEQSRTETGTTSEKTGNAERFLTPGLIVALFLIFGFCFHLWHPGWILLLTIPLLSARPRSLSDLIADPIVLTIVFFILGFFFHLWHPGWMVFLLIPLSQWLKKKFGVK